MMNLNGLSQLNNNLKEHKSFGVYDKDGLFADFVYDEKLKRYQSDWGYLTIESIVKISKDENDERYIVWR